MITILNYLLQLLLFLLGQITAPMLGLIAGSMVMLLVSGVLAPIGALRWWAGWAHAPATSEVAPVELHLQEEERPAAAQHYLVYLSGIGDVSGEYLSQRELVFLERLRQRMPDTVVISDIFAFSVINRGLTDEQLLGRFWKWVHHHKMSQSRIAALGGLINIRNLIQVSVSADRRYGPIYNYGTAEMILLGLLRHGYRLDQHQPVTLMGYSGGGQIVLGSARYLKATLQAPVQVISLGGVMSDDPGIDFIDRITHIYGTRDNVQMLGDILFPGRWSIAANSHWNRAEAAGRLSRLSVGPVGHSGRAGYLDEASHYPDGTSYLDRTVEVVCQLIHEHCPDPPKT